MEIGLRAKPAIRTRGHNFDYVFTEPESRLGSSTKTRNLNRLRWCDPAATLSRQLQRMNRSSCFATLSTSRAESLPAILVMSRLSSVNTLSRTVLAAGNPAST